MSYKGKTYSKKGGGGKGNPFERMMKEQCNKPVAAKSAGIVGESERGLRGESLHSTRAIEALQCSESVWSSPRLGFQ